jgi:hypothetical protein
MPAFDGERAVGRNAADPIDGVVEVEDLLLYELR